MIDKFKMTSDQLAKSDEKIEALLEKVSVLERELSQTKAKV
jgi:hypothetical protein